MGASAWPKADLEEMYELVSVGDTVELIGQRNEETAQLLVASRSRWLRVRRSRVLTAQCRPPAATATTTTEAATEGVAVTSN